MKRLVYAALFLAIGILCVVGCGKSTSDISSAESSKQGSAVVETPRDNSWYIRSWNETSCVTRKLSDADAEQMKAILSSGKKTEIDDFPDTMIRYSVCYQDTSYDLRWDYDNEVEVVEDGKMYILIVDEEHIKQAYQICESMFPEEK